MAMSREAVDEFVENAVKQFFNTVGLKGNSIFLNIEFILEFGFAGDGNQYVVNVLKNQDDFQGMFKPTFTASFSPNKKMTQEEKIKKVQELVWIALN